MTSSSSEVIVIESASGAMSAHSAAHAASAEEHGEHRARVELLSAAFAAI